MIIHNALNYQFQYQETQMINCYVLHILGNRADYLTYYQRKRNIKAVLTKGAEMYLTSSFTKEQNLHKIPSSSSM